MDLLTVNVFCRTNEFSGSNTKAVNLVNILKVEKVFYSPNARRMIKQLLTVISWAVHKISCW